MPTTAFTSTGPVVASGNDGHQIRPGVALRSGGKPVCDHAQRGVGSFVPTNYTVTYVNGKLVVTPVPLVIAANDASKPFGTDITLPGTAFTSTGLVNGDNVIGVARANQPRARSLSRR